MFPDCVQLSDALHNIVNADCMSKKHAGFFSALQKKLKLVLKRIFPVLD